MIKFHLLYFILLNAFLFCEKKPREGIGMNCMQGDTIPLTAQCMRLSAARDTAFDHYKIELKNSSGDTIYIAYDPGGFDPAAKENILGSGSIYKNYYSAVLTNPDHGEISQYFPVLPHSKRPLEVKWEKEYSAYEKLLNLEWGYRHDGWFRWAVRRR